MTEPLVVLAIIDALLVAMFFLLRVLPWSTSGPWRFIWSLAALACLTFLLAEVSALLDGGTALSLTHQGPLFAAIFAMSACFILAYLHGHKPTEHALTLALTDELTELWNMRGFDGRLAVLTGRGDPFAIVYIDLDGFKRINDSYGHEQGDAALRRFGDLLREVVRKSDVAARIGGDEFALLLAGADASAAREVAERVLGQLSALSLPGGISPRLGASIGIATHVEGKNASELLKAADAAMYRAKGAGGNRVSLARSR